MTEVQANIQTAMPRAPTNMAPNGDVPQPGAEAAALTKLLPPSGPPALLLLDDEASGI